MKPDTVVCPDDSAGLSEAAAAAAVVALHSQRQLTCLKPLAPDDYNWQRYSYALQTGTVMMHRSATYNSLISSFHCE